MSLGLLFQFGFAFATVFLIVPYIRDWANKLGIIAHQNDRTIHAGIIPRIGGLTIYIGFLVGMNFFAQADRQINSIMIAGFIVFMVGFFDDIYCLKPRTKTLFILIAACIVVFYGHIHMTEINLPFLPTISFGPLTIFVTLIWIIGITNAINLLDGLDGLATGTCCIVLVTFAMISISLGREDVALLSMIVAGSCGGFLFYNFHPASIFLGDCGALFLGFMISVISLLGFGYKSTTFFALYAPIMILIVPISDTLIAIVRRKLSGAKWNKADKGHLHHTLMFKMNFGHRNSVLILYAATTLFSLSAYIYMINRWQGLLLFVGLMIAFELYVEYTGMINTKYHPILGIVRRLGRMWEAWKRKN